MEARIADLLDHRYGDGEVYLPRNAPRGLFRLAVRLGFLTEDGYLTRKGRSLVADYKLT